MKAYARDGDIYIFDPVLPAEIGPFSPDAARWMQALALGMRDDALGLRLSTELGRAADLAEAWLAALDGWHPSDFVGMPSTPETDQPIRIRICE